MDQQTQTALATAQTAATEGLFHWALGALMAIITTASGWLIRTVAAHGNEITAINAREGEREKRADERHDETKERLVVIESLLREVAKKS